MNRFSPRPPPCARAVRPLRRRAGAALALLLAAASTCAAAPQPLRTAFGDIASIDSLALMIALERTRERGIDIRAGYYESEDVAAQAVLSGGADIGVGAPYSTIERERPPIRLLYQLARMHFVPVFDAERYDDWSDLDGEEITVHSRGSGTEAIARLLADRHGIEYARINYVAGSEVRAGAMLAGDVGATLVDRAGWRLLREHGSERFQALPVDGLRATDEALYATETALDERAHGIGILLEEVLRTWREIVADPEIVARLRARHDLLPNLSPEAEAAIVPFYRDAVAARVLPKNGGGMDTVRHDLALYLNAAEGAGAGPETLDTADLWDFGPVRAAQRRMEAR